MTKNVNFEDTVFIAHMHIRMLRDLLHLDASPELFFEKTMSDMAFVDKVLEFLTADFIQSPRSISRKEEYDNLSNLEWQFNQLLTEISIGGEPFPAEEFPQAREKAAALRHNSDARSSLLASESVAPAEQAQSEPLVSSAEMSALFRGF